MHILAAMDGSRASVQAARHAAVLAHATRGSVVLARAVPPSERPVREDPVLAPAEAELLLITAQISHKRLYGPPAEAIPHELHARAYDMVTMGSRGLGESGVPSLFLGSTALRIVHDVPVPVLLVRATERGEPAGGESVPEIRSLLVPTDGSEASLDAADLAARLVLPLGAEATLLHVKAHRPPAGALSEEQVLRLSDEPFLRHGAPSRALSIEGEPAHEILRVAREGGYDLILMGTYGAGEPWHRRARMGSVAETVLIGAPCAVVLMKHR